MTKIVFELQQLIKTSVKGTHKIHQESFLSLSQKTNLRRKNTSRSKVK